MSEANQVLLRSLAESTYGTTPTNSTGWQEMRFVSTNLAGRPKTVISDEIRSDRQITDLIVTGQEVGGDVAIELSDNTYDDWLQAAMCGTWAANVLKAGTTQRSFSLELQFKDWSPQQYIQFKGMRVGGMAMNFAFGEKVTGSFSFGGKQQLVATTSLQGSGSTVAATTSAVMNAAAGVTSVKLDGSTALNVFKSISLNLSNNMRPIEGVGSAGPLNQAYGRSLVTGTIEMYFDKPSTLLTKLLAGTTASFEWTVSDGTNSYTFLLPKLKFNSGNPEVTGTDTDVMQRLEFTALYDSGEATQLKITRAP